MIGAPFADVRASPNFGPRRAGGSIDLLLLHYTAMQSAEAALQRLCDPIHEVSAHYLITLDGRVLQLVCESQRAWHAGRSFWAGETDINSRSIGIELDNRGDHPFSNKQMRALIALCGDIIGRHNIPAHRVLGHSDVAIGRKADPGA
ncbi:MAG: N-acetylmuramoyl-L-alanine amidase, partial [Paracoccaceae bacterium]